GPRPRPPGAAGLLDAADPALGPGAGTGSPGRFRAPAGAGRRPDPEQVTGPPGGPPMADVVLSILAHPDDAEFLCAGTLCRLVREHGWQAHIASMTPGDCGSAELPPEEIGRIRRSEGARAAALIDATYHCLEERDLRIFYCEP